jgi:hypothetical protein
MLPLEVAQGYVGCGLLKQAEVALIRWGHNCRPSLGLFHLSDVSFDQNCISRQSRVNDLSSMTTTLVTATRASAKGSSNPTSNLNPSLPTTSAAPVAQRLSWRTATSRAHQVPASPQISWTGHMQRAPFPVNFSVCTDQDKNHTRSSNLHQQVRRTVCSTLPTSMGQKCRRAAVVYTSRTSIQKMGATSIMEVLSCKAVLRWRIRTRYHVHWCWELVCNRLLVSC